MTTALVQKLIACPFCHCQFCNEADLQRHLDAFKITGYAPNRYDHTVFWKKLLADRDKEFISNG